LLINEGTGEKPSFPWPQQTNKNELTKESLPTRNLGKESFKDCSNGKISQMDLKSYLEEIKAVLFGAEGIGYAYLFGSALKRLLPDSDVDILVGGDLDFEQKTALAMEFVFTFEKECGPRPGERVLP